MRGSKPSFLFCLDRERAYTAADRAHGAGVETTNDNNSTTMATAMATTAETRMKAVGGERRNPPRVSRVADGQSAKGMHGAAVTSVVDDDSYDNDDGVASVRHQDPLQAAQFKNRGARVGGRQDPTQEGARRGGVTHLPPRPQDSAHSRRRRDQRHGQGQLG